MIFSDLLRILKSIVNKENLPDSSPWTKDDQAMEDQTTAEQTTDEQTTDEQTTDEQADDPGDSPRWPTVRKEVERILTLLRLEIQEQGFTQREVQDALGWGRTYISQLLRRQKALRFEQIIQILSVIGVHPSSFFARLYLSQREDALGQDPEQEFPWQGPRKRPLGGWPTWDQDVPSTPTPNSTAPVDGLIRLLVSKRLIDLEEYAASVEAVEADPPQDPRADEE